MSQTIDLIGQEFGRLTVISRCGSKSGRALWKCVCTCGAMTEVTGHDLRAGETKSCGCLYLEKLESGNVKHGMRWAPEYRIWCSMIGRCESAVDSHYRWYGGRGIKVAPEFHAFEVFYAHIGPRPAGSTLERLNTNGDYAPGNVCWLPSEKQQRNTTRNHVLTYQGKTQCLAAWAEDLAIPYGRLKRRIRLGWAIEKAFTATPAEAFAERKGPDRSVDGRFRLTKPG